jgi:hypothetical protein
VLASCQRPGLSASRIGLCTCHRRYKVRSGPKLSPRLSWRIGG